MSGIEGLKAWIVEREAIRVRKEGPASNEAGPPWTADPILSTYRFCNVRREDDKVTRWIAKNWRTPNMDDPDLWFAMLVARFINWPDTLEALGYPAFQWDPKAFLRIMAELKASKKKVYTGAYMVRADREHADKAAYQEAVVFTPMWNARERLRPKKGDTLNSYHMLLGQFHGLGSFMAAQIVADLKYCSQPLIDAVDWSTFAASGPGSRRGLNRVRGCDKDKPWAEEAWRLDLKRLQHELGPIQAGADQQLLHAQDLQNCLCEFDKYERVRLGEGKPRSKYP